MGARKAEVVYTYDVPEAIGGEEIRSVGLVELKAEDEIAATKRARGDQIRLAFELGKQSFRYLNGERLSLGDGSADRAWNALPSKVRNLVLQAFTEIHTPEEDVIDSFRASRRVETK